ncbi:MAG: 3-oxo-tetronate kinase [Hyphomicrobiaceae bacterium]
MLLGCIADDITGATDLALILTRSGLRTVQVMGVLDDARPYAHYDAVVVALKSRTAPVEEAVGWSLQSADSLLEAGARQIFFKYCSTFDSTDQGNIGPVAEALATRLAAPIAIVCPAFPANARTIYQGHLFVGTTLLSDSPMKDHPLTPMRDANLVRVLARQTAMRVGQIVYSDVARGHQAIRDRLQSLASAGHRFAVVDALSDHDLMEIGKAVADHPLVTGGSGVAMGLADNFVAQGLLAKTEGQSRITAKPGRAAILAGSCSAATREQVAYAISEGYPALKLEPHAIAAGAETVDQILTWAVRQSGDQPVLVYSSDTPQAVEAAQALRGKGAVGALIEQTIAGTAKGLAAAGFTKLIVAGGETSGAVSEALKIKAIEIGPEIDPGVPWVRTLDDRGLAIAFKSGNFGQPGIFRTAWSHLS